MLWYRVVAVMLLEPCVFAVGWSKAETLLRPLLVSLVCTVSPPFSHPARHAPPPPAAPRPADFPQKPYLPLGSLRAQMLYPHSEDEVMLTPASMEGILEQVQLGYLCSRSGGLGAVRDWQDELSLGEQQVRGWGAARGKRVWQRTLSRCLFRSPPLVVKAKLPPH